MRRTASEAYPEARAGAIIGAETQVSELDKTGTILAERYELREQLAQGGLGKVHLGRDLTSHRDVVVKWVPTRSPNERARQMRESRVLSSLTQHSAGVVRYLDQVQHQDELYLVTEHIPGETLEEWQSRARRTPDEILAVYQRIAQVLHEIHRAGVAHRDLKPSNVMITEDEARRVVLIDFGLAIMTAEVDNLTGPGTVVGTPRYISPEILQGATATPASDIFALGVMLCEALLGRPPWSRDGFMQLASAMLTTPPDLGELAGTPLGALLTAMLAKEPEARPRALEVMHALGGAPQAPGIPLPGGTAPVAGKAPVQTDAPPQPKKAAAGPATRRPEEETTPLGMAPVGSPTPRHGVTPVTGSPLPVSDRARGDTAAQAATAKPTLASRPARRWLVPLGITIAAVIAQLVLFRDRLSDLRFDPAALLWLALPAAALLVGLGMRLRRSELQAVAAPALPPAVEARLHAIERRLEHMSAVSSSIVIELGELRPHLDPGKLERMLRESILIAVSELKVGADAGDVGKAIKALAEVAQRGDGPPPWHKRMSTWLTLGGLVVGVAGGSLGLLSNTGLWKPNAPPAIRAITVDRERATRTAPIELRVDAMDPEGKPLSYRYAASFGQLSSDGPLALWHPDPAAGAGLVRIDVTVSDGAAQVSHSRTLRINRRPELAIAAPASAARGAAVQVLADGPPDPDGDALTYRWSASAGQLRQETTRQPTLIAPAEPGVVQVRCTVSDGWETWDLDGKAIAVP
jgi:predicted Ser/Thr protein kinase